MFSRYDKPADVTIAAIALWAWTAWTCIYGVIDGLRQIPDFAQQIDNASGGMLTVDPAILRETVLIVYPVVGLICVWIIIALGHGKEWARSSVVWGVGCEVLMVLLPPYKAPLQYLSYVPDIGLQVMAMYYLYTAESRAWFVAVEAERKRD